MVKVMLVAIVLFCSARAEELDFTTSPAIVEMHSIAMRRREVAGLRVQSLDQECCRIAQRHANWMAANNNMSHGGGEAIIASGYSTAEQAINAWENSSGHRSWLFGGSDRCGWGCQRSSNGTWYWAGAFRNVVDTVTNHVFQDIKRSSGHGRGRRFLRRM